MELFKNYQLIWVISGIFLIAVFGIIQITKAIQDLTITKLVNGILYFIFFSICLFFLPITLLITFFTLSFEIVYELFFKDLVENDLYEYVKFSRLQNRLTFNLLNDEISFVDNLNIINGKIIIENDFKIVLDNKKLEIFLDAEYVKTLGKQFYLEELRIKNLIGE